MASGGRHIVEQMANHCSAAGVLAEQLGLSTEVRAGIEQSYARWDGRGVPGGLGGDALALSARISHIAETAEVFQRTTGIDEDTFRELLDLEPMERPVLTDDELDGALEAIGDFCDMRCPYFAGHARGTADLVAGAAESLAIPPAEARLAHRAAFVHDIGRIGVPASVWDKPGHLTASDRERMRIHVYYV